MTFSKLVNPLRTAVPFWGYLGANYLKFEWFVPKMGLQFLKGLTQNPDSGAKRNGDFLTVAPRNAFVRVWHSVEKTQTLLRQPFY